MADERLNSTLQGVASGLESLKATLSGVSLGLQNLAGGIQSGGSAAMSGLGRMMPLTALPQMGPMGLPRHGMYAHEMSFTGSLGMMTGLGTRPAHMSAYEMQTMASRDMGDRIAGFGTMASIYGAGMAASSMAMSPLFGMGSSMMGGMGGMALGGAMAVGGAMFAIPKAFEALAQGVQEHAAQTNYIRDSSYRYAYFGNQIDPIMGTGFNRQAAGRVATGLKRIEFQDMTLDRGDIQGILETGTQYDLFRGAADPDSFLKKFKDLTTSVKKMASAFHTSLGEAVKMIGELDRIGIQGSAAISNFATKSDVYGMTSGRTAGEMASVGFMGAEMVRGTGLNMGAGAGMLQSNVSAFTSLQARGVLSNELVQQGGGIMGLSQGVAGAAINSVNNPFMRVAMTGMVTSEGNLNMSAFNRMAGGATPMQLIGGTMGALGGPADYINAFVNADRIKQQMSTQAGGAGAEVAMLGMITGMAKQLHPYVGGSMQNLAAFTAQTQFGMTQPQWAALLAKGEQADTILGDQLQKLEISGRKQYEDVLWERGNIFGRAWRGTKAMAYNAFVEPATRLYQGVAGGLEETFRDVSQAALRGGLSLMGERAVRRESVTGEQYTAAVAGLDDYLGGPSSGRSFREDELTAFSKSTDYMQSVYEHRGVVTNTAFLNAKGADEMSHMMFNRNYNNLTKQEKMTIAIQARGNGAVTTDISNMEKKVQVDYTNRMQVRATALEETKAQQMSFFGNALNRDVNAALGGMSYNIGYEATTAKNFGVTKELIESSIAVRGDMSKLSAEERAAAVARNQAAIKAAGGIGGGHLVSAVANMDLGKMRDLGQVLGRIGETSTELKTVEIAEKGRAYLDSIAPSGKGEEDAVNAMKYAFSSGAALEKVDFKALKGSTDPLIQKALAGFDIKKGTLAQFREKFASNLISKGGAQDIQGDPEGSKQMQTITDTMNSTASQFKEAATAMKNLMSQINPLITKLSEKGYLVNATETTR